MPIITPGRRIGAAYSNNLAMKKRLHKGKRSAYAPLLLTPMVDMFTILVLYLIQQFNATGQYLFIDPDMKLPTAKRAIDVVGNPPVVSIGKEQISVQGKPVEETAVLEKENNWEADGLVEALTQLRETSKGVETATGGQVVTEAAQGLLVIQADLSVPYRLIKKVIFNAQKAGFTKVDFAVSQGQTPEVSPEQARVD